MCEVRLRFLFVINVTLIDVEQLRQYLEDIIWQGSLMKGSNSDLLIMIGDESVKDEFNKWGDYYRIFEWRNDSLKEVKHLD